MAQILKLGVSLHKAYTKREDMQIENETLVVGIDIAKRIQFARSFDNRRKQPTHLNLDL